MSSNRYSFSPVKRRRIAERDGWTCRYCKTDLIDDGTVTNIDHVIPLSEGGTNDLENLALACVPCNKRKRTLPAPLFLMKKTWEDLGGVRPIT